MNIHVVVVTSPIDADGPAPRLPTIDASIYCIMIADNCAIMAGILKETASRSCCKRPTGMSLLTISDSVCFSFLRKFMTEPSLLSHTVS